MADEFPGAAFSHGGKPNTPVLLIDNEGGPLRCKPLKHSRYRRGPNSESLGKSIGWNAQFLGTAQFEDGFQVIVNRFRRRRRDLFSCHYF